LLGMGNEGSGERSNRERYDAGPDYSDPWLLVGDACVHGRKSTGFDDLAAVDAEWCAPIAEGGDPVVGTFGPGDVIHGERRTNRVVSGAPPPVGDGRRPG